MPFSHILGEIYLRPVNKFRTRNGGHRWQVNKTKTDLLRRKNAIFVISWLKKTSLGYNLQFGTYKLTMSGPISLTSVSKKKSLKGFMRTIRLKLGHVHTAKAYSWEKLHFSHRPLILFHRYTKPDNNNIHFLHEIVYKQRNKTRKI